MLLPFVVLWAWHGAVAAQPSGEPLHPASPAWRCRDADGRPYGATAFVKAHAPCGDEIDAAACTASRARHGARAGLAPRGASPGRDIFGGQRRRTRRRRCPGKAWLATSSLASARS